MRELIRGKVLPISLWSCGGARRGGGALGRAGGHPQPVIVCLHCTWTKKCPLQIRHGGLADPDPRNGRRLQPSPVDARCAAWPGPAN
jgi:hypothetical protein